MQSYSVEAFLKATGADKFKRDFNSAADSVGGLEQKASGFTLGKLVGAIGITAALSKGFQLVKDSIGHAFTRIDTMEQFERVMTTMTGSSKKANAVLDTINDTVVGTAYGLDYAAKSTQDFVTSGMDVDKATDSVASWGDAVAFYGDGSNESFASVTDALAKMTAKGKVQMDTMNRLTEAGIPAMQIYADATGQSVEEVAEQMQAGALDADEFITVMNDALANGTEKFEGIEGAAKEAGASWGASFDNMKAAVARGITKIIESIDEMLTSNGLPDMREMVARFGEKFEEVLTGLAEKIPEIVDKFREWKENLDPFMPLIKGVATGVVAFVAAVASLNSVVKIAQGIWAVFNAVLFSNPITAIIAAFIAGAALIVVYWEPIKEFFSNIWEGIKTVALAIWEPIKEAWNAAVEFLSTIWNGVSEWFSGIWEGVKEIALAIWEPIKEAWNSVVEYFTELWADISQFFSETWETIKEIALLVWEPIKEAWNVAVEFLRTIWSPIGEFFASLWQSVQQTTQGVWEVISTYFGTVWEVIKTIFSTYVEMIKNVVTTGFNVIKTVISTVWNVIKTVISTVWEVIKTVISTVLGIIKGIVSGEFNSIKDVISAVMNGIKSVVSIIWNAIKSVMSTVLNGIKKIVSTIWNGIKNHISIVLNGIKNIVSTIWNGIKSVISSVLNAIKSIISSVWSAIKSVVSGALNGIKSIISSVWNSIKSVISSTLNGIKSIVTNIWNGIKSSVSNVLNGMKSAISNAWSTIKSKTQTAFNKVKDFIKNPLKNINLFSIGKNIVGGLVKGIKSMAGKVKDAAKSIASGAKNKLKSFLGIASPSKVTTEIGEFTGEGLVKGILKTKRDVEKASGVLAGAGVPDMDIAEQVNGINARSQKRMKQTLENDVNLSTQPIVINIEGDSEWIRAYVNEQNAVDAQLRRF